MLAKSLSTGGTLNFIDPRFTFIRLRRRAKSSRSSAARSPSYLRLSHCSLRNCPVNHDAPTNQLHQAPHPPSLQIPPRASSPIQLFLITNSNRSSQILLPHLLNQTISQIPLVPITPFSSETSTCTMQPYTPHSVPDTWHEDQVECEAVM